jgi:hypothetical protein
MVFSVKYDFSRKKLIWVSEPDDNAFVVEMATGTTNFEPIYQGGRRSCDLNIDNLQAPVSVVVVPRKGAEWGEGKLQTII